MKKTKSWLILFLTVVALLSLSAVAYADDSTAAANVITVSGSGMVKVAPNVAEVSFAVITEAEQAGTAQAENAALVNKTLSALKNLGINQNDIATSGYNLGPRYIYGENKAPRISGYEVRNEITVTVRNIEQTGKVIDTAIKSGINQAQNIRFYYEGSSEPKAKALRQAISDAKVKADVIAAALGKKIVGIKSATGNWYDNAPTPILYSQKEMLADGAGAATPVTPGLAEIRANADITYIIE